MLVQYNMMAENALNRYKVNNKNLGKRSERLSTGYRINRAADDAAVLQISEKLRTQIRGLDQADDNIIDGISLIQTADGAMGEIESMLHRMRELSVQAANDTNTEEDRMAIQEEIDGLKEEVDRVANHTEFNTVCLLNNSWKNPPSTLTGLAYILGNGYITTSPYLGDTVKIGSTGWVVTGNTSIGNQNYRDYITPGNNTSSALTGPIAIPTSIPSTTETLDADGNIVKRVSVTAGGGRIEETWTYMRDANRPISPPVISNHRKTEYDSTNNKLNETIENITAGSGGTGNAGAIGVPYATGFLDFSGLGTKYSLRDLVGRGFNTTCQTCNKHYSIFFTNTGTGHKMGSTGYDPILEFDVATLGANPSGADMVKGLVDAIKTNPAFTNHYTQYAYDPANPTKLYVYDNRSNYTANNGTASTATHATFEPTAFGVPNVETPPRKPFNIQVGANEDQKVELYLPWVTIDRMGLNATLVNDHDSASQCITLVDKAIDYVSNERSIMGAYQNRLEHASKVDQIGSENQQSAESLYRDANIADEMVEYSKYNILLQASQAMLVQTNQTPRSVLDLLK